MASVERPGKDLVPTGLDGELSARFDSILQNAADHLELFSQPDEITHEIKRIGFGRSGEESLAVSHTNDRGFHSGMISYIDGVEPERTFIVKNTLRDGMTWDLNDQRRTTGFAVLHKLQANWPLGYNREMLDELIERSRPESDDHPPVPLPVEDIFAVLESLALHSQPGSIEVDYEKCWDYTAPVFDKDGKQISDQALRFVVIADEVTGFRHIRADVTLRYDVDGASVPLVFHVHSDEFGNILVNASYKTPLSNTETSVPIRNYQACFDEVSRLIDALVAEKTTV